MPSSMVPNVWPSKRSGVCTVCPARDRSSAKVRMPGVSPSAWWKSTTSAMSPFRGSEDSRLTYPAAHRAMPRRPARAGGSGLAHAEEVVHGPDLDGGDVEIQDTFG